MPTVEESRLMTLKEQLERGEYQVDAERACAKR
jgi:anti-sigma28 factor (negative regulator of flagellin synthesis)